MGDKNIILVEFYEGNSKKPFASSNIPEDQLPDTFEIDTKLTIADQNWSIINAIPKIKADFIKSEELKIYLNKIEVLNPKDILFSMPTINNSLCEVTNCETTNLYMIHEDDWRQVELIDDSNIDKINDEIAGIDNIYKNHYVEGGGFSQIFIREKIETPLSNIRINIDDLKQEFEILKNYNGFTFHNVKGMVKNSFAFEIEKNVTVYGLTSDDYVLSLCIVHEKPVSNMVIDFMKKYKLIYVNWCKLEVIKA